MRRKKLGVEWSGPALNQAEFLQHLVGAFAIHDPETVGGEGDGDRPVQFRDVQLLLLQVGLLNVVGFVVGVGNAVPVQPLLACYLTDPWHCFLARGGSKPLQAPIKRGAARIVNGTGSAVVRQFKFQRTLS